MRALVVAADYPWPEIGGSRIRLANTVTALAGLGEVDLLSIVPSTRTDFADPPAEARLSRFEICTVDPRRPGLGQQVRTLLGRTHPVFLPAVDLPRVHDALTRFATGKYDVVWFFTVRAWVWAGEPPSSIVDIDDLEDQKILAREALKSRSGQFEPGMRQRLASKFWAHEANRWVRLHRQINDTCTPVVCSELDARRSQLSRVVVIPNGYREPSEPLGRIAVGSTPTVLFQGSLRYPPNLDAAKFLASEIAPRLAGLVPGVQVRLVGLAPPALEQDLDSEIVTLVGMVPEMSDELARADVVVVPLRFGSGTRIKILEAFAHGIPVVSTSLGAEGLDVRDGVHLLIADEPEDIAKACARLFSETGLRETIAANSSEIFHEKYEAKIVEAQILELAMKVAHA